MSVKQTGPSIYRMTSKCKPYVEACDENGQYILNVLKTKLPERGELLDSFMGQHRRIHDVTWQKRIAEAPEFTLAKDIEVPVNNRTLVWRQA